MLKKESLTSKCDPDVLTHLMHLSCWNLFTEILTNMEEKSQQLIILQLKQIILSHTESQGNSAVA